jgi:hypothetical protein
MALPVPLTDGIEMLLAVVRRGDADRLGWWRSHSVDETAEYVLGESFPSTWMRLARNLSLRLVKLSRPACPPLSRWKRLGALGATVTQL